MYVYVLNSSMNTLQKIFVMVGVGSLVTSFLGIIVSEAYSLESYTLVVFWNTGGVDKVNWVFIISVFNIVVSSVGFFLFKDK